MRPVLLILLFCWGLGAEVSATSRSTLAAPPPVTPIKPNTQAPAATPTKQKVPQAGQPAKAPVPAPGAQKPGGPQKPAGRTAAPGGKPQGATGQAARNGIGQFSYVPDGDPVGSVYKDIEKGRRRRSLLTPAPAMQPQPTAPAKPRTAAPQTAKKPEAGKQTGKPQGQGARSGIDSIGPERPIASIKP